MKTHVLVVALIWLTVLLPHAYALSIPGTISTIASGGGICDGSKALDSILNMPYSAIYHNEELYIADTANHRVRKLLTNGYLFTIAGTGDASFKGDNKLATAASLNTPRSVAVSSLGEVYIADTNNHRVRKILTNGHIITIAGNGTAGNNGDNLQASDAMLRFPTSVVIFNEVLYIVDSGNNRVCRLFNNGTLITVETSMAIQPITVAIDSHLNIYVECTHKVCKIEPNGNTTVIAGTGTGSVPGPSGEAADGYLGTAAKIDGPTGSVTFDQFGNVIFADRGFNKIRRYNITSGIVSTAAGITYEFEMTYFAYVLKYCGNGVPITDARLYSPTFIHSDSLGNIYFVDSGYSIRKILPDSKVITIAGTPTIAGYNGDNVLATKAKINYPTNILTNSAGTGVNGYSSDGLLATNSKVSGPDGIVQNSNGDVFFADTNNHRIAKVSPDGILTTIAGITGSYGYNGDNILATQAKLNEPKGLFIDSNEELYFADYANHRIRKILSNGTIITIAGNGISGLSVDGLLATQSSLKSPNIVQVDPTTNEIYIVLGGGTANRDGALASESTMGFGRFHMNHHGDVIYTEGSRIKRIITSRTCNGTFASDKEVCNGVGTCTLPDVCVCPSTHIGKFCEIPICNGIPANSSSVCNGIGECVAPDQCNCNLNYIGQFCEIPACNGTSHTSPQVCNGFGACSAPGVCTCDSSHTGQFCEITACNGTSSADPQVCNSAGVCSSPGVCTCNSNYAGQFCQYPKCNGISSTDANVCLGRGSCTSVNKCTCSTGYYGDNCESMDCFGIPSVNGGVCSGNGQCVQPNLCSCRAGFTGEKCELFICNGIISNSSLVCNSHGSCNAPNACACRDSFYGSNCETTTCYGVESSIANVCHKHGTCKGLDKCECNGSWFGMECQLIKCFGVTSNESQVCGGYGSCDALDTCTCTNGWTGSDCSDEVPLLHVPDEVFVSLNRVPFNVKQYLTCDQCNISQSLQYSTIEWNQISGPSVQFSKLISNNLEIVSFPNYIPQKYIFEVSFTYKTVVKKTQVSITTKDPDFSILLYQTSINSSHVTVGVDCSPESISSTINSSTWTWKCKNSDLITDCDQSILDELNYSAFNRLRTLTLKAASSKSIVISLKIKSSMSELPITFPQDQSAPIINLVSVSPQKTSFSTSDKLSIQIMINIDGKFDGFESKIKREWKLNGENLISPILTSPTDSSKSNLVTIDISRLVEGSTNNLTCIVTNLESKLSSVFTYVINVDPIPKSCSCNISPSTGYVFDTLFTVNCSSNCLTSPQSRLQYSFKDFKTGIIIPLDTSSSTQFTTQLPYTGSSNLVVLVAATDLKTLAKYEMTLNVVILLPKAISVVEVKKKKATWDGIYKNTLPSPKKTVYGYISTAIDAMMQLILSSTRSLTCLNGGVYNSELKMCNCTDGFKKIDCGMLKSDWLDIVNDKWVTVQPVYEVFNLENQLHVPTVNSIAFQASLFYHLFEKFDEISRDQLEQGIELFKKLIQHAKSNSYIDLQPEVINCIAYIIRLLENGHFSFDGNSLSLRKFILDSLTDLEEISFRYQQVANPTNFETMFITVTSQKLFAFELSNSKIGDYLELPSDVTKYLPSNANIRTPLNLRVWKTTIPSVTNQTVQTIDNIEISTSLTNIDYSLSLDLGNSQILNIPQQDQVLSYLFTVTPKVVNSQTSQPIDGQKSKVTTGNNVELKSV